MVLTRRSGDKLKASPKANQSIQDDDFPSIKIKTRSSGRHSFDQSLRNRSRHGSRDDHSKHKSLRLSHLSPRSITNEERANHQMSLRSIGLDDEGSSCEEEDVMDALEITPGRGGYSKNAMPRRSSRNRKNIYDTLNISRMETAAMEHDILDSSYSESKRYSKQHRHSLNPELRDLLIAQGKDPDDAEGLSQPDIYSTIKARHRMRRPRRYFDDFEMSHTRKESSGDAETNQEDGDEEDDGEEEEGESDDEEEQENGDEEENGDNGDDDEHEEMDRRYSLRTKRAQPLRLIYELQRPPRPQPRGIFDHLPRSPARRKTRMRGRDHTASPYQRRRRRTNSQGASSSDSTSSSDDENKFERRKKRSMLKARNRCMPMNLSQTDLAKHGFSKERRNIGSSLADVDPMQVDKSTMFSSVGGHQKHIRALKEMVVFPLLYPEVFERFHITPPRGCLFYGPPGTGKTLMARALANECSIEGKKVAFFMRKGADCLSKWVGESERQLRLLFDQAYQMRPAIIFFDEIDGLAPVRSSRQDQIHSSIVSTLLALMDGLDSRGEIIVIGATNRIDSIDPALRRPGRFDREFLFPLPDETARLEILKIHTSKWNPPLSDALLRQLSERTVGYCGADIKSACTEAAVAALRRRYPQIYSSNEKLKLDISSIEITACDFYRSMQKIVPTARRSANNPSHALNPAVHPLLINSLLAVIEQLVKVFPIAQKKSKLLRSRRLESESSNADLAVNDDSDSDFDSQPDQSWSPVPTNGLSLPTSIVQQAIPLFSSYRNLTVCRPRLLICGAPGNGQSTHLAPALLHDLEGFSFHLLDIPSMYGLSSHTPEEACAQVFREARRTSPSIIYIPNCVLWWEGVNENVHLTFQYLLQSLPASCPVVIIATCDCLPHQVPPTLSSFFCESNQEKFVVKVPTADERTFFFAPVFLQYAVKPPTIKQPTETLEILEKAEAPAVTQLSEQELKKIEESEEATLRSLRLFLRDILTRLARDRRFKAFLKPVDTEDVPDYTEVISQPMDLSTMVNKIDQHKYVNVKSFLVDIDLICSNALEYNPDHCAEDKAIRHRACLLKDMSHAMVEEDLDPNFERLCNDVQEARRKRMADPLKYAPSFYKVLPRRPKRPHESNSSDAKEVSSGRKISDSDTPRKTMKTRPRRKRSAWASGVLSTRKRRRATAQDASDHDEQDDNSENQEITENGIISGSEHNDKEEDNEKVTNDEKVSSDVEKKPIMDEDIIAKINGDDSVNEVNNDTTIEIGCDADHEPKSTDVLSKDDFPESDVEAKKDGHSQTDDDENGSVNTEEKSHTEDLEESKNVEILTPRRMMLRSKSQSCSEAESSSVPYQPPPVIADHHKLKHLLLQTVSVTASSCVEDLEKLYSMLMGCIYKHRREYDKTTLIQDFEKVVQQAGNELQRSDSGFHL